ncbi:hypothetical protein G9A89_001096 [Geosiphon pyriformis]|nr:hypothetical protein G9A89_001096 [Geosiphon pyriformis]
MEKNKHVTFSLETKEDPSKGFCEEISSLKEPVFLEKQRRKEEEALEKQFIEAISNGDYELTKTLLDEEGDVWYRNEQGVSPLHFACLNGHFELVTLLLENGHAWNAVDLKGVSAAEYAKRNGHEVIYQRLLEEGCRVELILGYFRKNDIEDEDPEAPNQDYLTKPLHYSEDGTRLLDYECNGVMMGWERPLMDRHAEIICTNEGLDILNIGFGLGLVDDAIQRYKPRSHTIIEAHTDVFSHMIEKGWDKKPGIKIIFGRWQDVLEQLETYDGIFFDTFGEFYDDLQEFHEELPNLLRAEGVYSFFNGLGATNPFFHDVYCRIAEMHLLEVGMSTQFQEISIDPSADEIWEGVKGRYWTLETYRLPICQFLKV